LAPRERLPALKLARDIAAGQSPYGLDLTDSAVLLFALLDGSSHYFSEYACCQFGTFFAQFAEVHRPSIELLRKIAEFEWNNDWVIAGAIFGLAQMRSSEGRSAFREALASTAIDIYDKYRAVGNILQQSALAISDLPADFWDLIHTGVRYRISDDKYNDLKRLRASAIVNAVGIDSEWVELLDRARYMTNAGYRSGFRGDQVELKRSRLDIAAQMLTTMAVKC
jgi:hypothetical protein